MILLTDPKIIFLKARKVAGTSFEIALSKFATDTSIITPITDEDEATRTLLGYRGPQNYLRGTTVGNSKATGFFNHISASEARHLLGNQIWSDYKKISIIRNPFDYAVSSFFWSKEGRASTDQIGDFEPWVLSNQKFLRFNDRMYYIDGADVIDLMLSYERLDEGFSRLEATFPKLSGIAQIFKTIRAKGQYRPITATVQAMFSNSPRAFSLISEAYKDEIAKYEFEIPKVK